MDLDYPDLTGTDWAYPRAAWEAAEPARPPEERLALVALAGRARTLPARTALRAWPFTERAGETLATGAVLRHIQRGLAVAAQLIAEAPCATGPGLVRVDTGPDGVARVVPSDGWDGPDRARIVGHLAAAAAVGLTDEPLDLSRLPLELAAANPPDPAAPPIEPAAFAFAGTAQACGMRLWRYRHRERGGYLNLDEECWPWRYQPGADRYVPCSDGADAAAAIVAACPAVRDAGVGL